MDFECLDIQQEEYEAVADLAACLQRGISNWWGIWKARPLKAVIVGLQRN
jgi:hypothetical protein